jgi:UMF1 family MFS transporter
VIISLLLINKAAETQREVLMYTRITFLLTGAWWFGFSQYTFKHLPKFGEVRGELPKDLVLLNFKNLFQNHKEDGGFLRVLKDNIWFYKEIVNQSFKELLKVGYELFRTPNLKFFLASFFFYSVGIQTIILIATPFAQNELGLDSEKLIITLLIIQIVAIIGSLLFSRISRLIGNKNVISITIIIWMGVCLSAYVLKRETPHVEMYFYIVAAVIGLVMGGIQSMSRSTYSRLLPKDSQDSTTYFSFYDVLEKIAIIVGTFIFAVLIDKYQTLKFYALNEFHIHLPSTSGMRFAALAMTVFFIFGLVFIRFLKIQTLKGNSTEE